MSKLFSDLYLDQSTQYQTLLRYFHVYALYTYRHAGVLYSCGDDHNYNKT